MTAPQLNYPVNFVIPEDHLWEHVRQGKIEEIDEKKLSEYAVGTRNVWVGRTYFHLMQAVGNVSRSATPRKDAINVVAPRDFGRRDRRPDDFVVVPRCDSHRPMLANYRVVQCAAVPTDARTSYMPLWPQANIRPRDHEARSGVTRLAFKGRLSNLAPAFRSQEFIDRLSAIGVELVLDAFTGFQGDHDWGDYTDSDVTLAVRDKTYRDALHKPPSKLVNAWFGETPAIMGPEPAFQSIRKSPLDYVEVVTPDQVITALRDLRDNPKLYQAMIENGRQRRKDFTVESLTLEWARIFNERVGPLFEQWQRKSRVQKRLIWATMMIEEPISKRYYQYYITHGRRILDGVS